MKPKVGGKLHFNRHFLWRDRHNSGGIGNFCSGSRQSLRSNRAGITDFVSIVAILMGLNLLEALPFQLPISAGWIGFPRIYLMVCDRIY